MSIEKVPWMLKLLHESINSNKEPLFLRICCIIFDFNDEVHDKNLQRWPNIIITLVSPAAKHGFKSVISIFCCKFQLFFHTKHHVHIKMISEGSRDTEDWRNDAENTALITEINYSLLNIYIENN